jgi:hypothetical protein
MVEVLDSIVGMSREVPKDIRNPSTVVRTPDLSGIIRINQHIMRIQIVYCNLARFQPDEQPGWLLDTDVQRSISYTGDNKANIDNCKSSNPLHKQYPLAYTENQLTRHTPSASQITLCPCECFIVMLSI